MVITTKLVRFDVNRTGGDFMLHVEDDEGHSLDLSATRDQLDILVDALDDVLLGGGPEDEIAGKG